MSKPIPPSSLIRLYVSQPLAAGRQITLDQKQGHYLYNVMRKRAGDIVGLFNGIDGEWRAHLTQCSKKSVTAELETLLRGQETDADLWLCFAPIKKTNTDFIVEKATELGVSALMPIKTANTATSRVNEARFLANATEAAEQCERLSVPEVRPLQTLETLLAGWPPERAIMFCDEGATVTSAHQALTEAAHRGPWAVLTGPEGGFDDAERALLRNHPHAVPVSLGRRTLRAETAVVVALAIWQSALGDGKQESE